MSDRDDAEPVGSGGTAADRRRTAYADLAADVDRMGRSIERLGDLVERRFDAFGGRVTGLDARVDELREGHARICGEVRHLVRAHERRSDARKTRRQLAPKLMAALTGIVSLISALVKSQC